MLRPLVAVLSLWLAGGLDAAQVTIEAGGSVILQGGAAAGGDGGETAAKVAELETKLQRLQAVVDMMMNASTTPFVLAPPSPPAVPPPAAPPPTCNFKQYRLKATGAPPSSGSNVGWWIVGQLEFFSNGVAVSTASGKGSCIESSHYNDDTWCASTLPSMLCWTAFGR